MLLMFSIDLGIKPYFGSGGGGYFGSGGGGAGFSPWRGISNYQYLLSYFL